MPKTLPIACESLVRFPIQKRFREPDTRAKSEGVQEMVQHAIINIFEKVNFGTSAKPHISDDVCNYINIGTLEPQVLRFWCYFLYIRMRN